jgi:hypothetical protein
MHRKSFGSRLNAEFLLPSAFPSNRNYLKTFAQKFSKRKRNHKQPNNQTTNHRLPSGVLVTKNSTTIILLQIQAITKSQNVLRRAAV